MSRACSPPRTGCWPSSVSTLHGNLSPWSLLRSLRLTILCCLQDDPDACSVVVQLVEKPWYNAHAATYVQSGETTMELGAGIRNVTGRAEHISANVEYGWNTSSTFSLGWAQPMPFGLPVLVSHSPVHTVETARSTTVLHPHVYISVLQYRVRISM